MKKGFTLVELLAVIVVISVVLLLAVPKIGDVVEQSRMNTFLGEAKNVFKMAELVSVDNLSTNYISSEDETKLHMDGNDLKYCITIDTNGEIESIIVKNGKYSISGDSNFKSLDTDAITEDDGSELNCGNN